MIVLPFPQDYAGVLQLTGDGNCAQLADLPEEVDYLLGLEDSEGNPIFCSGNNPVDKTQCYTYHLVGESTNVASNPLHLMNAIVRTVSTLKLLEDIFKKFSLPPGRQ